MHNKNPLDKTTIAPVLDRYGFLADIHAWNIELAHHFAKELNICLGPLHLAVINFARQHYLEFEIAPSMRLIVQHLKTTEKDNEVNSVTIANLFPGKTALHISKIAGLPKPSRCT